MPRLRLMAVLAHPDDECLGAGGTLAKYAADGVDVFLLTATRGEGGRYRGHRPGDDQHPGSAALATIREAELRAAASVLGVREVSLLDCADADLDRAAPRQVIEAIVSQFRRVRPDVVLTFGADGAYGHPDHIAISQFTTAAVVAAADPGFNHGENQPTAGPHAVSKLYYVEAVLHRVAGIDLGRLPRGGPEGRIDRGRPGTTGDAVARLGNYDDYRHSSGLAHGMARGLLSRISGLRLRATG